MASKRELLEQRRKMKEAQAQASAISTTETVLDILTNEEENKNQVEEVSLEENGEVDKEKASPKKKSTKSKNEKIKSKLNLLEPEEKRSVQQSIYLKPSTYNELMELLDEIKKNSPKCGISTFNDLINEIIKVFLED